MRTWRSADPLKIQKKKLRDRIDRRRTLDRNVIVKKLSLRGILCIYTDIYIIKDWYIEEESLT